MNKTGFMIAALALSVFLGGARVDVAGAGQPGNCPSGQVFSSGSRSCTVLPSGSRLGCPSGLVANGFGSCMAPLAGTCRTGTVRDAATGACARESFQAGRDPGSLGRNGTT